VVEEVALLVVELHDGGGEHAEAGAGQNQAHAATPRGEKETHGMVRRSDGPLEGYVLTSDSQVTRN